MNTPMNRSHAQQLRDDRVLTYASASARASYWAKRQSDLKAQEQAQVDQNVAEISQGAPRSQTQFAGANIEAATLVSAAAPNQPSIQAQAAVAGLGPEGIAPPPPA
jgi:hypothetical protein